ncbi:MAG: hypothetical protein QXQ53_03435 [Candidatus Methanosuratincola sp.]
MSLVFGVLGALSTVGAETFINTASIFELWPSARVAGMGGAFIALANDEAAIYYNPAGLAFHSHVSFFSLFNRPFDAFSHGVLSFVYGSLGAQLFILDSDPLEERDLYGNIIGTFRYTETGLIFSFGFTYATNIALGLQWKIYLLALPTQAFGCAWSPSVLLVGEKYRVGIVWRNLVTQDICFRDGHVEPWNKDIVMGFSWQEKDSIVCLDFTENLITRGDIHCLRIGVESYRFKPFVFRVGTNREGTTFGFSLDWHGIHIDFAYLVHFNLPPTYVLDLSYRW